MSNAFPELTILGKNLISKCSKKVKTLRTSTCVKVFASNFAISVSNLGGLMGLFVLKMFACVESVNERKLGVFWWSLSRSFIVQDKWAISSFVSWGAFFSELIIWAQRFIVVGSETLKLVLTSVHSSIRFGQCPDKISCSIGGIPSLGVSLISRYLSFFQPSLGVILGSKRNWGSHTLALKLFTLVNSCWNCDKYW